MQLFVKQFDGYLQDMGGLFTRTYLKKDRFFNSGATSDRSRRLPRIMRPLIPVSRFSARWYNNESKNYLPELRTRDREAHRASRK